MNIVVAIIKNNIVCLFILFFNLWDKNLGLLDRQQQQI